MTAAPTVTTVLGPVPVTALGVVLPHEHVVNANDSAFTARPAAVRDADPIAHLPVRELDADQLRLLDADPYRNRDNCSLDEPSTAVAELAAFRAAGGGTVVDQTVAGIGRDPLALAGIARDSGVHVVMGCGFYLERSHPAAVAGAGVEEVAAAIVAEARDGVDGVRPGLIGEIGVSPAFTERERTVLLGAGTAQRHTGLPLSVHLPGWQRRGQQVLDLLEDVGVDPHVVALSHLNPAWQDHGYLTALAGRGAYLSFDMIGMTFDFPGEGRCPDDAQTATAVVHLLEAGLGDRVLLSHDTFLKRMWRAYGGKGYTHLIESFLPRLTALGVGDDALTSLTVTNPARFLTPGAPAPRTS